MALSRLLGGAGFTREYADMTAEVTLVSHGKGPNDQPKVSRVQSAFVV